MYDSQKSLLEIRRRREAERAYQDYDFDYDGGGRAVECANGWEYGGADEFRRTVFLEPGPDEDCTQAVVFVVAFVPNGLEIESQYHERVA